MSVYTELVKIGLQDDAANEIAEAVRRSAGVVTVEVLDLRIADLDTRLAQFEASLTRTILTTMIAMTGIFAVFVGAMAWVVSR